MDRNYPRELEDHFRSRHYRPETIATIGHWCRVGSITQQRALEFLELLEEDHDKTDHDLAGQGVLQWD